MSKKAIYILGILLTIILGSILYYYLCCCSCSSKSNQPVQTENTEQVSQKKQATLNSFTITDKNSKMSFQSNENFNFKTSDFSILNAESIGLNSEILKVGNYVTNNPNKVINIHGLYTSTEENNSVYPNLGLARANSVKNYLTTKGVSSKQINTNGVLNDSLVANEKDVLFGPVSFDISTIDPKDTSNADALKKLREEIKSNPLVMHFEIGNTSISLTPEQREKIANISRYIDKVDNAKIEITGHTDNTGDRASNIKLGLNRANFAKEHFVNNAISESKIAIFSKGPDQPIADNSTKEGRSKNRRVIVTIN